MTQNSSNRPLSYLAILGRQPEISLAELEALGIKIVKTYQIGTFSLAKIEFSAKIDFSRLGGTQKLAILLEKSPLETLLSAPEGKITFGISEFSTQNSYNSTSIHPYSSPTLSPSTSVKLANSAAQKLKRALKKQGRSVRIVESPTGVIPTATSLHNGLSGKNPRKFEFIHFDHSWYRVTGVQNIDAYAKRDQNRPARDAKIGMLPPKLAQVLLNLASALPPHSRILDPFCGTGVVLQEATLMGYDPYGTDINPKMVTYAKKNLTWLEGKIQQYSFSAPGREHGPEPEKLMKSEPSSILPREGIRSREAHRFRERANTQRLAVADARIYQWEKPIDAVVTEGYLGKPFSHLPSGSELREEILTCKSLILAFLKNLAPQIAKNTPVILCAPAWLRETGDYLRLNILDDIENLGYNVENKTRKGLLYRREGQIVARDIIILRKK